ncbi:MAG: hydrolase 2, exosortase A system-associated [Colwellia sp.]
MAKVSTQVEFYQGTKANLFRIIRTPKQIRAHLLFIAPLFEQANQTRHHVTRSAMNAYHQGIQSIVFDHYGTGDSQGELIDASLSLWQQDILKQLLELKKHSNQAVYLSLPLSAVLLLSNEIVQQLDGVMLLQPNFKGKRFIQQFKRLALAANLTQSHNAKEAVTVAKPIVEIAGYLITPHLLDELAGQSLTKLADFTLDSYWFEWLGGAEVLSLGRAKQQEEFARKNDKLWVTNIDDVKFWQATELQVASTFLTQERVAFSQIVTYKSASNKALNAELQQAFNPKVAHELKR